MPRSRQKGVFMSSENEVIEGVDPVIDANDDVVAPIESEGNTPDPVDVAGSDGEGTAEPVAYEPNYKFKVKDEEHELDEWAQKLITNKETEDHIKKLYSKGFGIEGIQTKRDEYKTQLDTVQGEYAQIKDGLQKLSGFVQQGDISSFLGATGISKEQIFDWVAKEIQYQEMPADQKAQIDYQRQVQYQAQQLQEQNQMLNTQLQQQTVAQKAAELDIGLSDQRVSQIAKAFDTRPGNKPGDFRSEVTRRGHYHFVANNQNISAKQAIDEVIQLLGSTQQGQNPVAGSGLVAPQVPQHQKPVLPNISGSGSSPVKAKVLSLDDLRKRRDQLLSGQ